MLSTAIGGFIDSWRAGRVAMLSVVTGGTAFGLGASPARSVLAGLLGALLFLAVLLFFAMTGGRVLGDVRDMPADGVSGVRTIPLVFGMRFAAVFLAVSGILAYVCGIAAWLVGDLGGGYLACMLAICVLGSSINVFFLMALTPRRADLTNRLSLGLLGGLYTSGMVFAGLRLW